SDEWSRPTSVGRISVLGSVHSGARFYRCRDCLEKRMDVDWNSRSGVGHDTRSGSSQSVQTHLARYATRDQYASDIQISGKRASGAHQWVRRGVNSSYSLWLDALHEP